MTFYSLSNMRKIQKDSVKECVKYVDNLKRGTVEQAAKGRKQEQKGLQGTKSSSSLQPQTQYLIPVLSHPTLQIHFYAYMPFYSRNIQLKTRGPVFKNFKVFKVKNSSLEELPIYKLPLYLYISTPFTVFDIYISVLHIYTISSQRKKLYSFQFQNRQNARYVLKFIFLRTQYISAKLVKIIIKS